MINNNAHLVMLYGVSQASGSKGMFPITNFKRKSSLHLRKLVLIRTNKKNVRHSCFQRIHNCCKVPGCKVANICRNICIQISDHLWMDFQYPLYGNRMNLIAMPAVQKRLQILTCLLMQPLYTTFPFLQSKPLEMCLVIKALGNKNQYTPYTDIFAHQDVAVIQSSNNVLSFQILTESISQYQPLIKFTSFFLYS